MVRRSPERLVLVGKGRKENEPIGNLDMMIAAQALAVEAVLVTSDRAFRQVKGLKIRDWSKA